MFIHVVLFWLAPEVRDQAVEAISADCDRLLKKVPTVKGLWVGEPAMTSRPIVDNTYDVGLCVVFADRDGHDEYQSHRLHLEFVANHKAAFKKVQVYDFVG